MYLIVAIWFRTLASAFECIETTLYTKRNGGKDAGNRFKAIEQVRISVLLVGRLGNVSIHSRVDAHLDARTAKYCTFTGERYDSRF